MNTAILIIGYNRFDYFKQVVDSLALNRSLPTYVYLDNCGDESIINQHILYTSQALPYAKVTVRAERMGCSCHIIDAKNEVFEMGYDRLFVFEDDLVVTPNYVDLCINLFDWVEKQPYKIGMVQAHPDLIYYFEEQNLNLKPEDVVFTMTHGWGYLQSRQSWLDCRQIVDTYRGMAKSLIRSDEENASILDYFKSFKWKPMYKVPEIHNWMCNPTSTGQDQALAQALTCNGYYRLTLAKARSKYIGAEGYNGTKEYYDQAGYANVVMYDSEEDKHLKTFSIMADSLNILAD